MTRETGKRGTDAGELCRVRRISDGWHLCALECAPKHGASVNLRWWPCDLARHRLEWPRAEAERIAAAMMILTGETGIEIEPVEG